MLKRALISCSIFLSVLPNLAAADTIQTTHWKTVGNWDIGYYDGEGCQLQIEFTDGANLWMGMTYVDEPVFGIWFADDSWTSIEDDKRYELTVEFDRRPPWDLEMVGFAWNNGLHGVRIFNDNSDQIGRFVDDFMSANNMRWTFGGRHVGTYPLHGSRVAMEEVFACQKSFNDAVANDPFAYSSSSGASADPFR